MIIRSQCLFVFVLLMMQRSAHAQSCSDSVISLDCCRANSGLFLDGSWSCGAAPTNTTSWGFSGPAPIVLTVSQGAATGRLGFTDAVDATIELFNSSMTVSASGGVSGIVNNNLGENTALFGFSTESIVPAHLSILNRGSTRRVLNINGDVVIGTLGGAAQLSIIGPNLDVNIGQRTGALVVGGTPSSEIAFSTGSSGFVDIRDGAVIHSGTGDIGSTVLQSTGVVILSGPGTKWINTGAITLGIPNTLLVSSSGLLIVGDNSVVQSSLIVVNHGWIFGNGVIISDLSMQDEDAFINPGPFPAVSRLLSDCLIVDGDYTQSAGTLHIDLQFPSTNPMEDRLHVSGHVQLGGELEVSIAPHFVPILGDVYTPVFSDSTRAISGVFDVLSLPQFPDKRLLVDVVQNQVTILVTAAGDCVVDAADIACILAHWFTNDHGADLNQDGVVDALDLAIATSTLGQSCS